MTIGELALPLIRITIVMNRVIPVFVIKARKVESLNQKWK